MRLVLWRGEHFLNGDLQHYHKWQRSEDDRAPKEKGRSDSPEGQLGQLSEVSGKGTKIILAYTCGLQEERPQ